jgi:hypothetical protein
MDELRYFDRNMTYREALLEAALTMKYFIDNLQDRIFEITMTGEMKEWSESVPTNEEHQIGMEVFEACDDINVTSLLKLLKDVDRENDWFMKLNGMDEEEVKGYDDFKFNSFWDEGWKDE